MFSPAATVGREITKVRTERPTRKRPIIVLVRVILSVRCSIGVFVFTSRLSRLPLSSLTGTSRRKSFTFILHPLSFTTSPIAFILASLALPLCVLKRAGLELHKVLIQ